MNRAVLLSVVVATYAQTPPPKPIVSPEVHPDRTVTFRLRAPNAQVVNLSLEGVKAAPMQKDEAGIWTYTSPVLEPDIYGYTFNIDGVGMMDPNNSLMKPNLLNNSSAVHIAGEGLPWEMRDIPHGEVHHHFYKS